LFIDDQERNIGSAAEMGLKTHHFRHAESLGNHLRDLGIFDKNLNE